MLLLIDAYNLLHHSDVLGRGRGVGWLERARRRLIHELAMHLDPPLAAETCLVFDAQDPPPDLPHEYRIESIRLHYAVGYPEADDLIEELIARHPTPRRLTVVSSDHRIQRAAARRGASFFDADLWYDELRTRGPRLGIPWPPASNAPAETPEKPSEPATAAEVAEWYDHFSLQSPPSSTTPQPPETTKPPRSPGAKEIAKPAPKAKPAPPQKPKAAKRGGKPALPRPTKPRHPPAAPRNPHRPLDPNQDNPFPEGYGEDLEPS